MECQSTEIAAAEASSGVRNGKGNLFNCRHAAVLFVRRMVSTHIRQRIDTVKLFTCQGRHRRVYNEHLPVVIFRNGTPVYVVTFSVLFAECLCVEGFEGKKREAMRRRAAEALLCAMDGMNARERDAVRELSGACGACAARLLTINPQ